MNARRHLGVRPFVIAIVVALAVVLSAPLIGQIRGWIRATFPGRFVLIVGAIAAVMLAGALLAAAIRIRENRARRFGAIAAALTIAAVYSVWNASDNPESNAVERFHFLEYGLITWLFYRAWRPLDDLAIFLLPTLAGIVVGTAEEWLQWFIPNRVGELRDIFLNLVAIVCGLLFSAGMDPPPHFEAALRPSSSARVLRLAAVTVLALAAFFHSVHLGYEIADSEIGSFTSRYAPEELPALQAAISERWQTQPPPLVLRRISREDQYLSEGLAHVRWRNRKWAAGEIVAAWKENLILEKYFSPVLDTPTYEGRHGHRWPIEQRADAQARIASVPRSTVYVSDAYPYRIYTWRKTFFWAGVIPLIGGLTAASLFVPRKRTGHQEITRY